MICLWWWRMAFVPSLGGTILLCLRLHRFYVGSKLLKLSASSLRLHRLQVKRPFSDIYYLLHKNREHAFYLCGICVVCTLTIYHLIYTGCFWVTVIQYNPYSMICWHACVPACALHIKNTTTETTHANAPHCTMHKLSISCYTHRSNAPLHRRARSQFVWILKDG